MENNQTGKVSILDILAFLARWRRVWIPSTIICAVALTIYAFTAQEKFRSVAVVRGVEAQSSGLGSILASKLSGLGNLGGFTASLGEVRGDYYLLILKGRAMSEAVIEKFGFRKEWKMEKAPLEDVIEVLNSRTYFKFDAGTNTVRIQADDKDPERAREICSFYVEELDKRNQTLESNRGRREREFMEQRLTDARSTLFALEDSMAEFQRKSGIFDLEEQAKATVQAVAVVQAQRTLAQAEYQIKSQLFEGTNPELQMAKVKLESFNSSLEKMLRGESDIEKDFLLRLDRATEDGKVYLRLYRDIEINSLLTAVLTQQFEQARLSEARNTPTMSVVEPPALASKRVWPKRGMLLGLGAILGFFLGVMFCAVIDYFRAVSRDTHPAYESVRRLKQSWRS